MNTKHVPDKELCQEFDRLCKEKGIVVPPTMFGWQKEGSEYVLHYFEDHKSYKDIPAPLVSELGEWLPSYLHPLFLGAIKSTTKEEIVWLVRYFPTSRIEDYKYEFIANTEANARQKMLNHLIAKGIITKI